MMMRLTMMVIGVLSLISHSARGSRGCKDWFSCRLLEVSFSSLVQEERESVRVISQNHNVGITALASGLLMNV